MNVLEARLSSYIDDPEYCDVPGGRIMYALSDLCTCCAHANIGSFPMSLYIVVL